MIERIGRSGHPSAVSPGFDPTLDVNSSHRPTERVAGIRLALFERVHCR